MPITSSIIADSINPKGNRLTSFVLEYPRYIHSEILTHRVFSKNAASSRAIPIEKMIQQVIDNPAMPTHWGKNQSGMQANEELSGIDLYECKKLWLLARDEMVEYVKQLSASNLHKQIANRILEPWFHIKIILSGTEFENFFSLRAHPAAHPDLQKLAYLMLEQYNESAPKQLNEGDWHIPFGDKITDEGLNKLFNEFGLGCNWVKDRQDEFKIKIAIARCARISYLNYEGKDDYAADIKLCDRLFGNTPKHLSPTEHVAQAQNNSDWSGNYKGFKQYRKFFQDENLSDPRVIKKFIS